MPGDLEAGGRRCAAPFFARPQAGLLHCGRFAGNVAVQMNSLLTATDILTSARMAAGMTSRARRPMTSNPAG